MGSERNYVGKPLDNSIPALIRADYPAILGLECATSYWGLSTFPPNIPITMFPLPGADPEGEFQHGGISMFFIPYEDKLSLVNITEHLQVTDREQTICDMIRFHRHEFHLYETVLSAYDDPDVDVKRLECMAEGYGILEELHRLYDLALETVDEG